MNLSDADYQLLGPTSDLFVGSQLDVGDFDGDGLHDIVVSNGVAGPVYGVYATSLE